MPPTLEEAEEFLKFRKIDENTLERLGEMLVTKMEDWHLIADQVTAESVWTILTEAGRRGRISEKLGDNNKAIRRVFEKIRPKLEAQLRTIHWSYNEIVDFDVKISKNNKSSLHSDPSVQKVSLNLKVLPNGKTEIRQISLDFDESQLEDFIWKLQEAKSMKDKILNYRSGKR